MELRADWTAVIVFMYNIAVVLTGFYAANALGSVDRVGMFTAAIGLALVWTVYFQLAMHQRLSGGPETEEDAGVEPP